MTEPNTTRLKNSENAVLQTEQTTTAYFIFAARVKPKSD